MYITISSSSSAFGEFYLSNSQTVSLLANNNYFVRHNTTSGAYDDPNGSHIAIEVTSALFEGKRPVQRQQLVYKALWEGT